MSTARASSDSDEGWAVTLAFWGMLLVAGTLFAAVSLAPRLKAVTELKATLAENQVRLVELERQAIELERIAEALENDPAFVAELTKLEFAAGRAKGERIAVPDELRLGGTDEATVSQPTAATPDWSVPAALLGPLATHRGLRAALLLTATLLVLIAFVALNVEQPAKVRAAAREVATTARRATDRYRKAA